MLSMHLSVICVVLLAIRGSESISLSRCIFKDCFCDRINDDVVLDCSERRLETVPEYIAYQSIVHTLDLSGNQLEEYPDIASDSLDSLDLSRNEIDRFPQITANANPLPVLHSLTLDQNSIGSLAGLRPIIASYPQLAVLSLADNPLHQLSSYDADGTLQAPNLLVLDLSKCQLTKITGQNVLRGMPRLEQLRLSGNPLRTVSDMMSNSLHSLDLSNCRLTFVQPNMLQNMPHLQSVNLARNSRLSLSRRPDEFVHSVSLRWLDVSFCNMDTIELAGFPNLSTAILAGNLISRLRQDSFEQNALLEYVDLSANAITHVSSNALQRLTLLKRLDLSYNMIRRIERETFRYNIELADINLSRNVIDRMSRIEAARLTRLNMSWCEVLSIDLDAFNDLPELRVLDLSNNLFGEFPVTLHAGKLQILDLSMCRLSAVRNETFVGFPDLTELRLSGNRFTTPFRVAYFDENPYLRDLWLGDNPWRCECRDPSLAALYNYLTEGAARLRDHAHMRCFSPDEALGQTWEVACADRWFEGRTAGAEAAQRVWSFLMLSIVVFIASICIIMSIRRCIENRLFERQEREREANSEEAREIMRRNQSILQQQAQLNAPDPRESRPPCYEDAILLPKFSGSFASLRAKFKPDADEDEVDGVPMRNRCRSEEVLSPRESIVELNRQARRQIIAEANRRISIRPALEIPPRFSTIIPAAISEPQPMRPVVPVVAIAVHRSAEADSDADTDDDDDVDFESIADERLSMTIVEQYDRSTDNSPYAQRRNPTALTNAPQHRAPKPDCDPNAIIQIVDDHYGSRSNVRPVRAAASHSSVSLSSNDDHATFTII